MNASELIQKSAISTNEIKKKFSISHTGKHLSKITLQKISGSNSSNFGKPNWNSGLTKETDERVKKNSESTKRRYAKGFK